MTPKILISSCLLGERVRYHGGAETLDHPILERWRKEGRLVPLCPEVEGGLPTPRPPAELQGAGAGALQRAVFVRRRDGLDVTAPFVRGAEAAVALAREHGIGVAVLKDLSPSCGSRTVYDGSFTARKVAGEGVTAAALRQAGVKVFTEKELAEADAAL